MLSNKIYYIRHYCSMSFVVECVYAPIRQTMNRILLCKHRGQGCELMLLMEVTHDEINESMVAT